MSSNRSPDIERMLDDIDRALDREALNIAIRSLELELAGDDASSHEVEGVCGFCNDLICEVFLDDFHQDLVSVDHVPEVTPFRKIESLFRVGVDYTVTRALMYLFFGK